MLNYLDELNSLNGFKTPMLLHRFFNIRYNLLIAFNKFQNTSYYINYLERQCLKPEKLRTNTSRIGNFPFNCVSYNFENVIKPTEFYIPGRHVMLLGNRCRRTNFCRRISVMKNIMAPAAEPSGSVIGFHFSVSSFTR